MIKLIELLIATLGALTGMQAGVIETPEPSEPIVTRIFEDGSYIMDGQGYCHPLGACMDGDSVGVEHEWVGRQLIAAGWAMVPSEVIGQAPVVPCTTDADCIAKNPHILEDPQEES